MVASCPPSPTGPAQQTRIINKDNSKWTVGWPIAPKTHTKTKQKCKLLYTNPALVLFHAWHAYWPILVKIHTILSFLYGSPCWAMQQTKKCFQTKRLATQHSILLYKYNMTRKKNAKPFSYCMDAWFQMKYHNMAKTLLWCSALFYHELWYSAPLAELIFQLAERRQSLHPSSEERRVCVHGFTPPWIKSTSK